MKDRLWLSRGDNGIYHLHLTPLKPSVLDGDFSGEVVIAAKDYHAIAPRCSVKKGRIIEIEPIVIKVKGK